MRDPGPAAIEDGVAPAPTWSWAVGLALLALLIFAAVRYFNGAQFLRLAWQAQPAWLAAALCLQALTYLAQGEVWRVVARAASVRVAVSRAFRLSLAKLFVDQTLPSAGVSGTVFAAKALERGGLPVSAGAACVGVNLLSYYLAYAAALGAAALGAALRSRHSGLFAAAACGLILLAAALGALLLWLPGRAKNLPGARWPLLGLLIRYLDEADTRILRSPRLLIYSALMQLAVVAADAATLWVLIRAEGIAASPARVFASFMISSVFRSVTFSPGGLGTFEASSTLTLRRAGVPVSVALSATLLFRGLSFWLPMIPGLWASRREASLPRPPRGVQAPA